MIIPMGAVAVAAGAGDTDGHAMGITPPTVDATVVAAAAPFVGKTIPPPPTTFPLLPIIIVVVVVVGVVVIIICPPIIAAAVVVVGRGILLFTMRVNGIPMASL